MLFRRGQSPYRSLDITLRGLDPQAIYQLTFPDTNTTLQRTGAELAEQLTIEIPERPGSVLVRYAKVE